MLIKQVMFWRDNLLPGLEMSLTHWQIGAVTKHRLMSSETWSWHFKFYPFVRMNVLKGLHIACPGAQVVYCKFLYPSLIIDSSWSWQSYLSWPRALRMVCACYASSAAVQEPTDEHSTGTIPRKKAHMHKWHMLACCRLSHVGEHSIVKTISTTFRAGHLGQFIVTLLLCACTVLCIVMLLVWEITLVLL